MRLFVTGLGGYLGHAVAATAAGSHKVCGTVRARSAPAGTRTFEIDLRDAEAVAGALASVRPEAVIHAAYVQDGADAWSINVDGVASCTV